MGEAMSRVWAVIGAAVSGREAPSRPSREGLTAAAGASDSSGIIAGRRSPVAGRRSPVAGRRSPVAGRRSLNSRAYAGRYRLSGSASPPEASASAGGRSDTRQPASSSDSFDLSTARAAAGVGPTVRLPRRGLLPALFVLPLLFGLVAEAAAQTVPTLKVEIPTVTEGETGTITLTLSQASSQSIDITVNDSAITCGTGITCPQGTDGADDNDHSRISGTITFAPSETEKTVSFTTTDDSTSESTELFAFGIGNLLTSESTIDPSTPPDISFPVPFWLVRIQDNDNPGNPNVTITPGTSPVTEGTAATFTVTATPAPTAAMSVSVAVTEETSGGQDFVASSNEITHTVSIPASGSQGAGSATLAIPTVGDSTDEPNGAVTATVSGGTGYTVGSPSSATVTVNNNNAPRVANAIPNQTATAGTAFSFQFPANTFSDADSDSLTYSATKSDDTALPSWLTFTAVTRTFSGTPQSGDSGTLSVKVTANDGN